MASIPDGSSDSMRDASSRTLTSVGGWVEYGRLPTFSGRLLRFVDQHDGDVVPHRIDVTALARAVDLLFRFAVLDRPSAVGEDQDIEELLVDGHRSPSPSRIHPTPRMIARI